MIILTLRTDKPEAEIGLYNDIEQLAYETWEAHRRLAETIHQQITDLLKQQKLSLQELEGIVVYEGPGSFTGLRIGLSVANALVYSLNIPIIGASGKSWIISGIEKNKAGQNDQQVMPKYGSPVHITSPKK